VVAGGQEKAAGAVSDGPRGHGQGQGGMRPSRAPRRARAPARESHAPRRARPATHAHARVPLRPGAHNARGRARLSTPARATPPELSGP